MHEQAILITLFLCGDVMTGRGIDQILPCPGKPVLYEPYIIDAGAYVSLAEEANGKIGRPVGFDYIWGDARVVLQVESPDLRIINLETAVTASDDYWPDKGINYRMHPRNTPCLTALGVDCCVLANNHVLDWGYSGLQETLAVLHRHGMRTAGAGVSVREAQAPAIFDLTGKGRVLVFAFGSVSSGIEPAWAAGDSRVGVNLLADQSVATARHIASRIARIRRAGDIVVASLHWGSNWGYAIPREQRAFAHALIDAGGADVIHGHSSHHAKGVEVYHNKPIIYGCGDFMNDYEGIGGYGGFRGDLCLMYFVTMNSADGTLLRLKMVPMQIRHFGLHHAQRGDAEWLNTMLNREGSALSTRSEIDSGNVLHLRY